MHLNKNIEIYNENDKNQDLLKLNDKKNDDNNDINTNQDNNNLNNENQEALNINNENMDNNAQNLNANNDQNINDNNDQNINDINNQNVNNDDSHENIEDSTEEKNYIKNLIIIWVEQDIDNEEFSKYIEKLRTLEFSVIKLYKNVDDAINEIKRIEFKKTSIILGPKIYFEFVNEFKRFINEIYTIPKIILFLPKWKKFIKNSTEYKKQFKGAN